jgi:hypothetical protein
MWGNGNVDEHHAPWADSGDQTPDADESMDVDMVEYEKRLKEVLAGGGTGEVHDGDDNEYEGGVGMARTDTSGLDSLMEKTGIGEEEFGVPSPRSSPPSTPIQNQRQLSYIREWPMVSYKRS